MKFDKEFFKSLLVSLVTGIGVGLVVGIYQFFLPYISKFGSEVFASRTWWVILLNVLFIIFLSLINFAIIRLSRSVDSSGIIAINLSLKRNEEIPCKKEIPLMITNSYVSTFAQMPLGSEGPSITLSGKVAALINKIFKRKDDENIKIAFGAGFGAAFLSPLGGFFYAFEEELHKIDLKSFLRTIVTMVGMSSLIFLLHHHHSLSFSIINYLPINDTLVLFLLFVLVITFAPLFLWFIRKVKIFYIKHEANFFVRYRGFFFFGLMLILGYTCLPYLGCGDKIIQGSLEIQSIYLLVLLLVFRTILTSIIGNGKVTGGLIVPALTLGSLLGAISSLCFEKIGIVDPMNRSYVLLLSMCMFFAFISEAPLTAITLFYSNLIYSTQGFNVFNKATFLGVVMIVMTYLVTKIFKTMPLYDMLVETEEEFKFLDKPALKTN